MGKLFNKINVANEVVGTDSEILGEELMPKQFNDNYTKIRKMAYEFTCFDHIIR